jgi:7SK snRNA methylphosphate capping enzyme
MAAGGRSQRSVATLAHGATVPSPCMRRGILIREAGLNFHAARVTGVDIDDHLIQQARSHLSFRCSRLWSTLDRPVPDLEYFPISAVDAYGHRPAPPARNVRFVAEDWVGSRNVLTSGPFEVIVALSVTKWIHLEHLDDGIRAFFKKCADCLSEGGHLIMEAQPWASYEKAVRPSKSPHFAPHLRQLRVKPEHFRAILESHDLVHVLTSNQLPRPISVYCKHGSPTIPTS